MKYYKTDSRKISFREYWHISPKGFWIAWWNKILGRQMNFIRGIPEPQSFKSRIIEAGTVPKTIFERLDAGVRDLRKIGFDQFWYNTSKQSLTSGIAYGVACLHSSRQIITNIIYVSVPTRERLVMAFLSDLKDGTILGTTNKKREFNPLPKHVAQRRVGVGAESLHELHQQKLSELHQENPARIFAGLDDVVSFQNKLLQQIFEDKIRRGIWVEMTDAEVAALRVQRATAYVIPQT